MVAEVAVFTTSSSAAAKATGIGHVCATAEEKGVREVIEQSVLGRLAER